MTLPELSAPGRLSQLLRRRFGRSLALVFTDVEGSTAYFARFGDEAGRALQQPHRHAARERGAVGGRIVDTAGDGAFACFPSVEAACTALSELQDLIAAHNTSRPPEHLLKVRCGIHWVTSSPMARSSRATRHFCSRVAGPVWAARSGSRASLRRAPSPQRLKCTVLPPVMLKASPSPFP